MAFRFRAELAILTGMMLTGHLALSQCKRTVAEVKEDLLAKVVSLDPLEGLWVVNVENFVYMGEKVVSQGLEEAKSEWAIIAEGDDFPVCDIGRGTDKREASSFTARFRRTSVQNLYIYEMYFNQTGEHVRVNAYLQGGVIEYAYYAPKKFAKEYSDVNSRSRLYWKFTWLKVYPLH